ncbi:MAG: hypothetical protein VB108_07665 [Anaerolineaceae bacterium]|nr:hypothetical protein [Anaerolineaceae bacterium]
MNLFNLLFGEPEIRSLDAPRKAEVNSIIEKLVKIGRTDDFLSVVPGGPFDLQCHHREARDLGRRLNEMGGLPLMMAVRNTIRRKLKDVMAEHLDHCWKEIGQWQA